MYTQCEKCQAIIPRMAVRCTTCGRSRMKDVFDSNVSSWKNLSDSELLSKKMQIEDELRRRIDLKRNV